MIYEFVQSVLLQYYPLQHHTGITMYVRVHYAGQPCDMHVSKCIISLLYFVCFLRGGISFVGLMNTHIVWEFRDPHRSTSNPLQLQGE